MGKHRKPPPEAGPGNGARILLTIEGMRVATVLSVVVAACVLIAGILTLAVAGLGGPADHPAGSASSEPGRVAATTTTGSPTQRPGSGSTSGTPRQPLVPLLTAAPGRPTSAAAAAPWPASPAPETPTSSSGASPSPTSSPTTTPAPGRPTITPPGRSRSKSPHP